MFRALDNLIVDRLDRLTLRWQKRGLNLVQLHVHVAGAVFVLNTGIHLTPKVRPIGLAIFGTLWFLLFATTSLWAHYNKDYRTNVRKTERLNARVLRSREDHLFWRMMALYLLILSTIFVGIDLWFDEVYRVAQMIFRVTAQIALALFFYLDTCVYIVGDVVKKEVTVEAATQGSQA